LNKHDEYIKNQLLESADIKRKLSVDSLATIREIAEVCAKSTQNGGKIMFCGNGGSAADSQHLAAELVVRLTAKTDRKPLPALALTTDTSILTASANDYGFDHVFSRQVEVLGKPGDVLIAISTSGNSPNVLKAVQIASRMKIITVGLSGKSGGKLGQISDYSLLVPSDDVLRIQEAHITIGHIIIGLIEKFILP
jgi:D-sedoheptulose 7-phosphate isomerase